MDSACGATYLVHHNDLLIKTFLLLVLLAKYDDIKKLWKMIQLNLTFSFVP